MVVVAVRLEWHTQKVTEVHSARHGASGGLIDDPCMYPVSARIRKLQSSRTTRNRPARFELGPTDVDHFPVVPADLDGGRGESRYLDIRTTSCTASPPRDSAFFLLRKGLHEGGHAAVYFHLHVVVTALHADHDWSSGNAHERVLLCAAKRDGAKSEWKISRYQLKIPKRQVRVWILPGPQEILLRRSLRRLRLTPSSHLEEPFKAWVETVGLIREGQEWEKVPERAHLLDFEPLTDGDRHGWATV